MTYLSQQENVVGEFLNDIPIGEHIYIIQTAV